MTKETRGRPRKYHKGQRVGRIKVLDNGTPGDEGKSGHIIWYRCRCECGNKFTYIPKQIQVYQSTGCAECRGVAREETSKAGRIVAGIAAGMTVAHAAVTFEVSENYVRAVICNRRRTTERRAARKRRRAS